MNKKIGWSTVSASLVAVLIAMLGCGDKQNRATARTVDESVKELKMLETKRIERTKELRAMNVAQLAKELEKDSGKGVEPFNSMPFSEVVSRGEPVSLELKSALTEADQRSLLGLLAMRRVSASQYTSLDPIFRVRVLVDALRTSKYFNKWGLPHLYWEEASKAIIAESQAAEPELIALLQDSRDAPVWGSEEAVEYARYKYRLKDYAWALLNEIRGVKVEIPTDPASRDRLISQVSR
jgi:hypothetical protein